MQAIIRSIEIAHRSCGASPIVGLQFGSEGRTPREVRQEIERMDRLGLKVVVTTDPRIVRAAELAGERP